VTTEELRAALERAWSGDRPHVERLTLAAAILQTALREAGMEPTLVGGGAVEFHVSGSYVTGDIDFVVERRTREAIDEVFTSLGLAKQGRHWVRGDLFVEVPNNHLSEPADEFAVGPYRLRVIRKEYVLADRIVGFRHWKYWAYGLEAMDMIRAFGSELDEEPLRAYLRKEGSEDVFDHLRELATSGTPVDEGAVEALWHRHYR
jgi:hypothetical protein